jgi:hypothetical protein
MWVRLRRSGVDAGGVEPRAEVVEAGVWVGQQVPGDHKDGAAGGDDQDREGPLAVEGKLL